MGIQELSIKGFRSLRDVSWRPGRLNVVIGPNGSGKSNLLRALELLHHSALGDLPETILRMGGMAPLLWDGQAQTLSWRLELDPPTDDAEPRPIRSLNYQLCLDRIGTSSAYRISTETLLAAIDEHFKAQIERSPGRARIFDSKQGRFISDEVQIPEDQTLLSLSTGPFFSNPLVTQVLYQLSSWDIYHDIRVDRSAPLREAAVARMDPRIATDGQNLVPVLHTLYTGAREFKKLIDDAMRVAFDHEYEELVFPPAADQRVQLRVRWRSLRSEQSAADLSDGTLRFLLLLAILANPDPPELIAIDEPEVGLHPSMLPLVAEHAAEAAERTQVIFTTHSAQFLDAFTAKPPTTTVMRSEGGETRLSVVDGDELDRWLHEYTLGTLFRSGELEDMA